MAFQRWCKLGLLLAAGCRSMPVEPPSLPNLNAATFHPTQIAQEPSAIQPVSHETAAPLTLADLTRLTLEKHPRLAQVTWAVEAARGRALQAGLYPNPVMNITADEISDRTGQIGIWGAPFINQEIVTHNKLGLSKAAALKEVDQATLAVVAERLKLLAAMQRDYWDYVAARRKLAILEDLVLTLKQSVEMVRKLEVAGEVSRLAVDQLGVELERVQADRDSTQAILPALRSKLAAGIGMPEGELPEVAMPDESSLPAFDLVAVRAGAFAAHPDLHAAAAGVERAKFALARAQAEAKPNVTLSAGYTYQGQNRSNDWGVGVGLPLPLWNRNEGNVQAARAHLASAQSEIGRVQAELASRIAVAYAEFTAAAVRSDRLQTTILPKAESAMQLAFKGRAVNQLDYLKVLEAQRAVVDTRLELVRSRLDARKAAADLAALMADDGTQ